MNAPRNKDEADLHLVWLFLRDFLKSDAPQSLVNTGLVRDHLSGDVEKIF